MARANELWLVFGADGQLGKCLVRALSAESIEFVGSTISDVDITSRADVLDLVRLVQPSVVVNAAGWTDVDGAESVPRAVKSINVDGARNVALGAKSVDAALFQISTDYVFDGDQRYPYTEDSPMNPTSIYGQSKMESEIVVEEVYPNGNFIFRTAWLYSEFGRNFAKTMVRNALQHSAVNVVADQWGQPTCAHDLANHLIDFSRSSVSSGTYHATNTGVATWYEFAREIYNLLNRDLELVTPISSKSYKSLARRPSYSVLGHERTFRAGVQAMRDWRTAIASCVAAIADSVKSELE